MREKKVNRMLGGVLVFVFLVARVSAGVRASVSLAGPGEHFIEESLEPPYTHYYNYSASGSYTLDPDIEQEIKDGEASVSVEYSWGYPGHCDSGGGKTDSTVRIYFIKNELPGGTISVTYTVTVTFADDTSISALASASIDAAFPLWETGSAISCEGITAPASSTRVVMGAEIGCSISPATDNDTRVGAVIDNAKPDTFSASGAYSWSTSAGSFKDDCSTGLSVTWIAPAEIGSKTITCAASDDAVIPTGEGGTRDDSDYTDTVTVIVVKIDHLECKEVTSKTNNPGNNETVYLPVGFNGGTVTVNAIPDPTGGWPYGKPAWSGDIQSSSGGTAQVDTTAAGTKTVTAECGNSVSIKIIVIEIASLETRRKSSGESFADSTTIAAGGYSSDMHKADIRLTINPVPTGSFSVDFPAQLSGAGAHTGTTCKATFSAGGSLVQEGNGDGTLTVTDANSTGGVVTGVLTSSNVINTCAVTVGNATATVYFRWDISGTYDYDGPSFFVPGIGDAIKFFPTLDEVAVEDEDDDGLVGEGAIGGHSMDYWTKKFTVRYWKYDYNTGSYVEPVTYETFDDLDGDNIEVHFGQNLHDLIDHSATAETATGVYENTQTVYDYYDYSGGVEEVIEVWSYAFGIYDTELFLSE
ncbi:MAG: hypothetical protein GXY53_09380 [Desulfobulbus sp.]|nr:hypothetical protein [Desulfobulbus sp.]